MISLSINNITKTAGVGDPAVLCNMYCYRMIRFHLILVNFATITNPTPNRYSALLKITLFLLRKKFSFFRYAKAPTLFVRPGNWLSSLRSAQAYSASILHLSDFIPGLWTPCDPSSSTYPFGNLFELPQNLLLHGSDLRIRPYSFASLPFDKFANIQFHLMVLVYHFIFICQHFLSHF